jgi:glutamate carboxypeptidase
VTEPSPPPPDAEASSAAASSAEASSANPPSADAHAEGGGDAEDQKGRGAGRSAPVDPDGLLAAVRDRRDDYLDLLCRLARIESPSTDPDAHAEIQGVLGDALSRLGYAVEHLPGRETGGSLYARPAAGPGGGSGGRGVQLLLGHEDTVWPHGTLDRMPVRVDAAGERTTVHGPGVFDMKAGLTSIVVALDVLDGLGLEPALMPAVLVTSDEETGSHESRRHIERLARAADRVFVLEPALGLDGKIKTARKGTGELEVVVRAAGDAAPGGNVVLELSHLVQRFDALNDPGRGVTLNVGTIDAGGGGSAGRLTVDVRVPTQDDAKRIDAALRALEAETPGVDLELHGGMERPPMERTPGNQRLWRRARALGRTIGLDLEEGRSGGASDGNFTSRYAPTLDGLGAVGDGAHAEHEHVDLPRTLERCALLALLLLDGGVRRES